MMQSEKSVLNGTLSRVLAIGASSGADIAASILAGFGLDLQLMKA